MCHTCVFYVMSKIVIVFVSCRRSHHWPFIKLGFRRMWIHVTYFNRRERLGWRTVDHLCVISMTHFPLWNVLLPFSLFLNANWYMLVDFVFKYGCFFLNRCVCWWVFLSWIVPVSQWVETPACVSPVHFGELHMPCSFFVVVCFLFVCFLLHTLYKCFFEPGFS